MAVEVDTVVEVEGLAEAEAGEDTKLSNHPRKEYRDNKQYTD
jgi:hypothetical protein